MIKLELRRIELRSFHMRSEHSTSELQPLSRLIYLTWTCISFLSFKFRNSAIFLTDFALIHYTNFRNKLHLNFILGLYLWANCLCTTSAKCCFVRNQLGYSLFQTFFFYYLYSLLILISAKKGFSMVVKITNLYCLLIPSATDLNNKLPYWSCGGLNSGLFACKANTLPLSYNPCFIKSFTYWMFFVWPSVKKSKLSIPVVEIKFNVSIPLVKLMHSLTLFW